jgi:hypothetical protein
MIAHAHHDESEQADKSKAAAFLRAMLAAAEEIGIPIAPEPLLIEGEAAAPSIGISERFLGALAITGDVPSVLIGTRRLYRPRDLRAWVDAGCPTPRWSALQASKRAEKREGEDEGKDETSAPSSPKRKATKRSRNA